MTTQKIIEAVKFYTRYFRKKKIPKKRMPDNLFLRHVTKNNAFALPHCHAMLDRIQKFLDQGKSDKANRWLGFIQACLWWKGHFTLEELKRHNKGQF